MITKPAPLESSIVKAILKYLNSLPECYAVKTYGDAKRAGTPDIDGCLKGRSLKLEVKRPEPYGTPLTKLQAETLERWRKAGAITGVVRSVQDVKELLQKEGVIEK
ncbi:MAG: hypothetical protein A4E55_00369 [Pelotomaculum sp. PtaU1.Bin035]|nr:MAG: hypothetical protein A4E55_00369 [Pelotomaculum sp. PtaU1.Bin035]